MGLFDFFSNKSNVKTYGAFISLGDTENSKETLENHLGKSLTFSKKMTFANVLNNVPNGKIWIVENGNIHSRLSTSKKITARLLSGFQKAYYCKNADNVEFLLTMHNREDIPISFSFPFAIKHGCLIHSKNPQSELNVIEYNL